MTLDRGVRLGHYEILEPIGAGGMGEVYKATDTRLDRTVAIKVLPVHLADSPERKERFEREARTISKLNHPNICTLYDIHLRQGSGGQVGYDVDVDFMVLEYIEGETLGDRVQRGPLSRNEALEYGVQITDALTKAHRAGVVHRDLKPGNIMLTKEGVKLLDFGLAKLVETESSGDDSDAPTVQKDLTHERVVVGTPRYMAPEQLQGGPVDARTDLYAYGLVLQEILKVDDADTERVVSKCLKRDPDERWQTARDLGDELRWLAVKPREASAAPSNLPKVLAVGLLLLGVILSVAWWSMRNAGPEGASPVAHFTFPLPENYRFDTTEYSNPLAISRDGSQILINGYEPDGTKSLFLRSLNGLEVTPITSGVEAGTPVFSWDGTWVSFDIRGEIRKVPLAGGAVELIAQKPPLRSGAAWAPDGTYVLAASRLQRVSSDGGVLEPLTELRADESRHAWPQILPDGKTVLFTVGTTDGFRPALASLDNGNHRIVQELGRIRGARYVAPGYVVGFAEGRLMAARFDVDTMKVLGSAVAVVDGVHAAPDSGLAFFTTSDTGTLLYLSVREQSRDWRLVRVDRSGNATEMFADRGYFRSVRVSPDGRRVAAARWDDVRQWDIWVYDVATGTRDRVATGTRGNPVWSPDGTRLAFTRVVPRAIVVKTVGSDVEEDVWSSDYQPFVRSWSPDGERLAIYEMHPERLGDIRIVDVEGTAESWLVTDFHETLPEFSPDGLWIAYVSLETGRQEIYVRPYPGPGQKIPISTGGGTDPRWSPDGRELFYRQGRAVMAVTIQTQSSFAASRPRELFDGPFASRLDSASASQGWYDVSRDGQHFLMIENTSSQSDVELHVILNWDEDLKRLVPGADP